MGAPSYNPVEIGAAPIIIETFFQSVTCIQRFWELSRGRYSRLTLMSSKQLAEHEDNHWYAETQMLQIAWHSINALPPFQYILDCPHLDITKVKRNRVI